MPDLSGVIDAVLEAAGVHSGSPLHHDTDTVTGPNGAQLRPFRDEILLCWQEMNGPAPDPGPMDIELAIHQAIDAQLIRKNHDGFWQVTKAGLKYYFGSKNV